jgi:hypothetical protein
LACRGFDEVNLPYPLPFILIEKEYTNRPKGVFYIGQKEETVSAKRRRREKGEGRQKSGDGRRGELAVAVFIHKKRATLSSPKWEKEKPGCGDF